MRIAVVSDASSPTPTPGGHGLGYATHILAETLLERGHDVELFAAPGSQFSGRLHTPEGATSQPNYGGEWSLVRAVMARHTEAPFDAFCDNSHVHGISHFYPSYPVVNVYHDVYQPPAPNPVVMSAGQQALMEQRFDRARIIWNWFDPTPFEAQLEVPSDRYALFCGLMIAYKQPILAIEAATRANIPLVMAGAGNLPLTPNSNVKHVGVITGKAKLDYFKRATVFLQLGNIESFGFTTLEAGLCGTPIVAWGTGGTTDLVKHGVNGAFIPLGTRDKVQAVADTIAYAATLDRGLVATYTRSLLNKERWITAYEQALKDVSEGKRW